MDSFQPDDLIRALLNVKHAFSKPVVLLDMPPAEFLLLHRIKIMQLHGEEITVSALNARADGRTMSSTSQILSSLEAKGLVLRAVSPGDRRRVAVSLTAEGEALMEKARQRMDGFLREVVSRLGAEKAARLCELADEAVAVFKEIKESPEFSPEERND